MAMAMANSSADSALRGSICTVMAWFDISVANQLRSLRQLQVVEGRLLLEKDDCLHIAHDLQVVTAN
jgi:hypothetical protein